MQQAAVQWPAATLFVGFHVARRPVKAELADIRTLVADGSSTRQPIQAATHLPVENHAVFTDLVTSNSGLTAGLALVFCTK